MKKFSYTIKDEIGIHARPAGFLVKTASSFDSEITISCDNKSANAKKLFSVMGLGAKCGSSVTITAEGSDEDKAIQEIQKFFESNL